MEDERLVAEEEEGPKGTAKYETEPAISDLMNVLHKYSAIKKEREESDRRASVSEYALQELSTEFHW